MTMPEQISGSIRVNRRYLLELRSALINCAIKPHVEQTSPRAAMFRYVTETQEDPVFQFDHMVTLFISGSLHQILEDTLESKCQINLLREAGPLNTIFRSLSRRPNISYQRPRVKPLLNPYHLNSVWNPPENPLSRSPEKAWLIEALTSFNIIHETLSRKGR